MKIRGRRHYLGPHGTTESEEQYRQLIKELWAKPPALTATPGLTPGQVDRLTIIDLFFAYWQHAEEHYQKADPYAERSDQAATPARVPTGTLANIKPALRQEFGDSLAAEFGPLKLKALREA